MRRINSIQDRLYFLVYRLTELLGRKLHAGLNHGGILLGCEVGIFIFIIQNPALALGYDLVAEFLCGQFVSPFSKRAFSKLLDVSFMHQGYSPAAILQRELDRHSH